MNINELPNELLVNIFKFVHDPNNHLNQNPKEFDNVRLVCKSWQNLIDDTANAKVIMGDKVGEEFTNRVTFIGNNPTQPIYADVHRTIASIWIMQLFGSRAAYEELPAFSDEPIAFDLLDEITPEKVPNKVMKGIYEDETGLRGEFFIFRGKYENEEELFRHIVYQETNGSRWKFISDNGNLNLISSNIISYGIVKSNPHGPQVPYKTRFYKEIEKLLSAETIEVPDALDEFSDIKKFKIK